MPSTTGSYNTFIGRGTGATAQVDNCTALGVDAYCDATNQVRLGNVFVSSIGGKVAWSALSDVRAKENIRDLSLGLDFVLALRPVEYKLRNGNGRTDMGFVAQDIEALLADGHNVLDIGGDPERTLSLRYTDLIAPMVKAIQEQQTKIESQQAQIEAKDARIVSLENQQAAQRHEIHAQETRIDRLERQLEALVATRQPAVAAGTEGPLAAAAREPTHLGVESRAAEPSSIRSFWPPGSSAARPERAFARADFWGETP